MSTPTLREHVIATLGFDPAPTVAAELAAGHITIRVSEFKTDPKRLAWIRAARAAKKKARR